MSKLDEKTRAAIAAWFASHPKWNQGMHTSTTAASLALSVVHWHHNVESSKRYGDAAHAENDAYFLRAYAILATKKWLEESNAEMVALEADASAPGNWYRIRDHACAVYNFQRALDDFEENDRVARMVKP